MQTWYLLLPGTRVAVSRDGAVSFRVHVTRRPLQFKEPTETTDSTMTFARGAWLIRVDRPDVATVTITTRWAALLSGERDCFSWAARGLFSCLARHTHNGFFNGFENIPRGRLALGQDAIHF